jgi:ribosomal protein S18 acetylase RimI-like enzyme
LHTAALAVNKVNILLRPALAGDEEFLFSVYASTRMEEMALVDWNEAQKDAFLRMQFRAQDQFYRQNYLGAEFSIILKDERPVGRLYLHRQSEEIHILDIALLPPDQRMGIGSSLLQQILDEAARNNLPVTIYVERFNPALSLYQRLGFRLAEDRGVHYFMRWLPPILEEDEDTRTAAKQ